MVPRFSTLIIIAILFGGGLFCLAVSHSSAATAEFRAFWADTWHDGILSAAQITDMVNLANSYNVNVIIPEVRKCGDAYYNTSPIFCPACGGYHREYRATNIIDSPPFDPLADIIQKAHAVGIQVHPWIVTYRIWSKNWSAPPSDHVWAVHPEWAMKNSSGSNLDGNYYNLDPGVPAVQDYLCKVMLDIVSRYDVDGFNWDYIRYPGYNWGYNEITKQRFYDEYGYWPPTSTSDATWETWSNYRRQQVTDLIKKCHLEIMAIKPTRVNHSVDTVGWLGGDPNIDYTQTRQYKDVFQNAKSWMEQHIIDTNILMNYKREYDTAQKQDYRIWSNWLGSMVASSGRFGVGGQGAYLNSISDTLIQMAYDRTTGCNGMCTYSYAVTNKDGAPNTDFWAAVKSNLYTTKVAPPTMTWKTAPTTGVLFGNVTDAWGADDPIYLNWLYKATVSISGPTSRSTTTDATGTYGFLDLPPGTYTVTCSKGGYVSQTTTVSVTKGGVIRRNFALDRIPVSSVKKDTSDNVTVQLKKVIVTAGSDQFSGCFYIEDKDRSSGIKVQTTDTVSEGSLVSITGTMATNTLGERYIKNPKIRIISTGNQLPAPLALLTKAVGGGDWYYNPTTGRGQQGVNGGVGLNNVGLLVRVFGKVTRVNTTEKWFYIDDGCGLNDGSGNIGLKVKCYELATGNNITLPALNSYVQVTGIVSITTGNWPTIRPRKNADIVTISAS
ncbi:MAG: family 10 glycosylhydrolase [Armatimonadota bacterium]|nr:family 10 glycosylhydrolase [Armatimonadota bacterium]